MNKQPSNEPTMQFVEPIATQFTYLAWNIDLHTIGPVVRPSQRRQDTLTRFRQVARELEKTEGVLAVRLLESTFIPPLPGSPQFDVMLLVNSERPIDSTFETLRTQHTLPSPNLTTTATNAARFGDTDAASGPVLLNHFVGSARPYQAIAAWKTISQWYVSVLKVTNSTLLEFTPGTPYIIMNYAVVPGPVARFMAGQLLRPSFYRNVTRRLAGIGAKARPLFAKRIDYSETA